MKIHSLLQSNLGVHLPLHISLSTPLVLRTEQRVSFLEKLENAVRSSDVAPFQLQVSGLDWVPNSEKTRWFLVLKLEKPENDGLNLLLAVTNSVVKQSGLEMLYADQDAKEDGALEKECVDRSTAAKRGLKDRKQTRQSATVPADYTENFHFSLAWQLEEPERASIESAEALGPVKRLSISCDFVKVKVGNTIHDIPLLDGTPTAHCALSKEHVERKTGLMICGV
jgi:U6 snRNA phosphodiesterase